MTYTKPTNLAVGKRCNSEIKISVELIRQTAFEQAQLRTPYFQQAQNLQKPANKYRQPVTQSNHLINQRPYMNQMQNTAT